MYVDRVANAAEHRERQPTAKMLAKFFHSGKQRVCVGNFTAVKIKSQTRETSQYAIRLAPGEPVGHRTVDRVDRHADGNGLTVAHLKVAHRL